MRSTLSVRTLFATFVVAALASSAFANPKPVKRLYKASASLPGPGHLVMINGHGFLDATAYRDIRNASLDLLRTYTPDKHFFVGLGRDGAPLIAFLQNLGEKDLAVNFPASSNSSGLAAAVSMAAYVKHFIPEHVLTSGKTIVFVDATRTGRGMKNYVPLLTPHLNGLPVVKAAFAIRKAGYTNDLAVQPGDFKIFSTTPYPEIDKLPWAPYESNVSEYPRHIPGYNAMSEVQAPLPQYQSFRDGLRLRMVADHELDQHLAALPGVE